MRKYIVRFCFLIVVCSGFFFLFNIESPAGNSVLIEDSGVISVDEWIDGINLEDSVILDIRTKKEFEEFHISDAINVDFYSDSFESELMGLDKGKRYFTYCRTGRRSGINLDIMKKLGFNFVYDLNGGIVSYREFIEKD